MKIYAMHMSAHNWHPDVSLWQEEMFHGEAILPAERAGIASHDLNESNIEPMRLVVNGSRLAEVFLPLRSCNLVVSERVMNQLQPLQSHFIFMRVEFEKVFNVAWPWHQKLDSEISPIIKYYCGHAHEMNIFDGCPHDEAMAASLPPYYEIVTPNHYNLLDRFPPTHKFFTMWYDNEPSDMDLLPVCRDLFGAYPITHTGKPIVRDDILEVLSPYLNRRFFGIKEFSFGE